MAEPILARAQASIEIAAPAEAVFDAWLDPAIAGRFLAAGDMDVETAEIDAREGGAFRVVMRGEDNRVEHSGRYVVIERPRRLIFTWVSAGTDWRLSLVTVVFIPIPAGVRVELQHEGLPNADRAARHEYGWETILAKLAQRFDQG